jgi:hypothetical protein
LDPRPPDQAVRWMACPPAVYYSSAGHGPSWCVRMFHRRDIYTYMCPEKQIHKPSDSRAPLPFFAGGFYVTVYFCSTYDAWGILSNFIHKEFNKR